MPPSLVRDLERVGRMATRWRAERRLAFGGAAGLLCLFLFGLSDLFVRFGRPGRMLVWLLLVALLASVWVWIAKALACKPTIEGTAAAVEKAFPDLDNHLINFLQFSRGPGRNLFKEVYLRKGVPLWNKLDPAKMKDRKAHKRALTALAVAGGLVVAPGLLSGPAWAVAIWRVVNPFSNTQPVSLTRIIEVKPGDATVPQGEPLVLSCRVRGVKGHKVCLDVRPADGQRTTYSLGKVVGRGEQVFSHRARKVTTALTYRFRAGDAPFPKWHHVTPRPPLALTAVSLQVTPPEYTAAHPQTLDGLADDVLIPEGSRLRVAVQANRPLVSASAAYGDGEPTPLARAGDTKPWTGTGRVSAGSRLRVAVTAEDGEEFEADVAYTLVPDNPPVIRILAPQGRATLSPGARPRIDFAVEDDRRLTDVSVERMVPGERGMPGEPVKNWEVTDGKQFSRVWQGRAAAPGADPVMAFRVVARDNCAFAPRVSRSAPIVFNAPGFEEVSRKRDDLEEEAFATLGRVIRLQRQNIDTTGRYGKVLVSTTPEHWKEAAGCQKEIRGLTRALLANPANPLGSLGPTVKKLYLNEMAEVITLLARVPTEAAPRRPALVTRSLNMENKILRQLTAAEVAAAQTKVQRGVSGLSGLLAALIKGENGVLKLTAEHVKTTAPVGPTLVDRQDDLASDLTEFEKACRREADAVRGNDEGFAGLLQEVADLCESHKIRNDMLLASEALDGNRPATALPHEQRSLDKLKALQERLEAVRMTEEKERQEEMLEALQLAREKLEKVRQLHERAIETMDMVKDQHDKDTKEVDLMEEEYQELCRNTKEALLEIPRDLQIFMELNVANELVEDVFSVFEEVEQEEGTEDLTADDVKDFAVAKREAMLEGMEEAEGRLDDIESFLNPKPDDLKVTTEPFDQEEMPEAGIALGALSTEAEDLIGDLLERQDDMAREADDGAINTAVPDMTANGAVMEGDLTSFAAKGKSGNETPDHKEQDGRSNVGRQGMSVGETAAGSGTINEGDKDIEARRTQDPTQSGQVDLDGEADTKATGGGKQATGKADDYGMAGGTRRMDSTEAGSLAGLEALMANRAESLYAKASLKNVRVDSLKNAAHHMRQTADAIAKGAPIEQVRELRTRAIVAMKRAKTELGAGPSAAIDDRQLSLALDDVVEGGAEEAPPEYRELVAEYYKSLSESL